MDLEQQELTEDIQQLELVLNSAPPNTAIEAECVEELDSEDEVPGNLVVNDGAYQGGEDEEPGPSGIDEYNIEAGGDLAEEIEDEEEEELQLGDNLETALALNRAYQEALRGHMSIVQDLLHKNREKQRNGMEQLDEDINEKKVDREAKLFSYPYFKDKSGRGPPKNTDTILRESIFAKLEPPTVWKVYQERLLLECLREQMKSKCLKDLHLRLKKVRQERIHTPQADPPEETEEDLLYTINCVKTEFTLSDVPVDDVVNHADWLTVANHHLDGVFSTEQCIAMYRNVCNPHINRAVWTEFEDEALKELTAKHGHQSWELVAQELGTDRSPFLCLQRYQQELNDFETATWTDEKRDKMVTYIEASMGMCHIVNWERVAFHVGDMTPAECRAQWYDIYRHKFKWTASEDMLLTEAVKLHSRKVADGKWMHISAHVKTRNSMQCRDRWLNKLHPDVQFAPWRPQDDKIMYDYVKAFIQNYGAHTKTRYDVKGLRDTYFPQRIGNSISQRLKRIRRKIDDGSLNDSYFEEVLAGKNGKSKVSQTRKSSRRQFTVKSPVETSKQAETPATVTGSSEQMETPKVATVDPPGAALGPEAGLRHTVDIIEPPNTPLDGTDAKSSASVTSERADTPSQVRDKEVIEGEDDGELAGDEEDKVVRRSGRRRIKTKRMECDVSWMVGKKHSANLPDIDWAYMKDSSNQQYSYRDGYPDHITASERWNRSGYSDTVYVVQILKDLLSGYPSYRIGSPALHTSLQNSMRLALGMSWFKLDNELVKNALREKKASYTSKIKKQMAGQKKQLLNKVTRSVKATHERVRETSGPRQSIGPSINASIQNAFSRPYSAVIDEETRDNYHKLYQASLESSLDSLMKMRHDYDKIGKNDEPVDNDLPYLLPPNSVTLNTHHALDNNKQKLRYVSKPSRCMLKKDHDVSSIMRVVKLTNDYKTLKDRVMSMLWWPTVMSRCQPDALSPDLMTYYQKVRRTKDEIARDEAWLTHGKLQKSKETNGAADRGDATSLGDKPNIDETASTSSTSTSLPSVSTSESLLHIPVIIKGAATQRLLNPVQTLISPANIMSESDIEVKHKNDSTSTREMLSVQPSIPSTDLPGDVRTFKHTIGGEQEDENKVLTSHHKADTLQTNSSDLQKSPITVQISPGKTIKYTTLDGVTKQFTAVDAKNTDNSTLYSNPHASQTSPSKVQNSPSKLELSPGKAIRYTTLDGVSKQFTVQEKPAAARSIYSSDIPSTVEQSAEQTPVLNTQPLTMNYTTMDGRAKKMSLAKLVTSSDIAPPKPRLPSTDPTNPDNVGQLQQENDPSASEPSVRFQIQAHAKGSKRALPPDVAATIFRCLQEKSVNPDKFKYRKPEVSFGSERRRAPKDETNVDSVVIKLVSDVDVMLPASISAINNSVSGGAAETDPDGRADIRQSVTAGAQTSTAKKKRGRKRLADKPVEFLEVAPNMMVNYTLPPPPGVESQQPQTKGRPREPTSPLKGNIDPSKTYIQDGRVIHRRTRRKPSKYQSGKATQQTIGLLANAIKNKGPHTGDPDTVLPVLPVTSSSSSVNLPVFPTAKKQRSRQSSASSNASKSSTQTAHHIHELNGHISPEKVQLTSAQYLEAMASHGSDASVLISNQPPIDRILWRQADPMAYPPTEQAHIVPSNPNKEAPLYKNRKLKGGKVSPAKARGSAMAQSTIIRPYYDGMNVNSVCEAPFGPTGGDDDIRVIRMTNTAAEQSTSRSSNEALPNGSVNGSPSKRDILRTRSPKKSRKQLSPMKASVRRGEVEDAFRDVLDIEHYSPKQLRKRPASGDVASTVSKALRTALDVSIEWHSSQESADSLDDSDIDADYNVTEELNRTRGAPRKNR